MATGDITLRVDLSEIVARLVLLEQRVGTMATQADIDRLNSAVALLGDRLTAAVADIRKDIADLKAAGVDTTALEASVARLASPVDDAVALAAENPASG